VFGLDPMQLADGLALGRELVAELRRLNVNLEAARTGTAGGSGETSPARPTTPPAGAGGPAA